MAGVPILAIALRIGIESMLTYCLADSSFYSLGKRSIPFKY